jgi:hypothetical protein
VLVDYFRLLFHVSVSASIVCLGIFALIKKVLTVCWGLRFAVCFGVHCAFFLSLHIFEGSFD